MTAQQKLLDQVTRWQEVEKVSLHDLNCDCWRCKVIQDIEHEARWKK